MGWNLVIRVMVSIRGNETNVKSLSGIRDSLSHEKPFTEQRVGKIYTTESGHDIDASVLGKGSIVTWVLPGLWLIGQKLIGGARGETCGTHHALCKYTKTNRR